ncbi:MAG: hypothetical protein VX463_00720, partial [Pseudomonadota bacterium]|nr:hypothetical protein [Pseudomonadota bacterium]
MRVDVDGLLAAAIADRPVGAGGDSDGAGSPEAASQRTRGGIARVPRLARVRDAADRWRLLYVLYQDDRLTREEERRERVSYLWQRAKILALQRLEVQREVFANDTVARRATGMPPDTSRTSQGATSRLAPLSATKAASASMHSLEGKLSNHLQLEMSSVSFGDSGAREITIYSPVLLVNRTKVTLHVKQYLGRNFLVLLPSTASMNIDVTDVTDSYVPLPVIYTRDTQTQIRAVVAGEEEGGADAKERVTDWSDRMQFSGIGLKQAIALKTDARKKNVDIERPQFDIGIEIVRAPRPFTKSLLVVFKDHHIFENLTGFDIEYKQRGSAGDAAGRGGRRHLITYRERHACHWDDIMKSFTIVVRPVGNVVEVPAGADGPPRSSSASGPGAGAGEVEGDD